MAVPNSLLCSLLSRASHVAGSYDYGVDCSDSGICKTVNMYFAGKLAEIAPDCTETVKLNNYVGCALIPEVVTVGVVTKSCAISISDIPTTNSCSPITINVIQ